MVLAFLSFAGFMARADGWYLLAGFTILVAIALFEGGTQVSVVEGDSNALDLWNLGTHVQIKLHDVDTLTERANFLRPHRRVHLVLNRDTPFGKRVWFVPAADFRLNELQAAIETLRVRMPNNVVKLQL